MAMGINYAGSGSITPICKWNSQSGRMFFLNRDGDDVEITNTFKAVMDLENLEVGSIAFVAGMAPDFHLVRIGDRIPAPPTDNHKPGCRVMCKLSKELGGEIREIASNAKTFLRGMDALHDAYIEGVKANPGKLPVVTITGSVPVTSGDASKKQTHYAPNFSIAGWVARPADLQYSPRAPSQAQAHKAPPSTGSTPMAAPVAAQTVSEDDFC